MANNSRDVLELCKLANTSSSNSRSIIYIVVIVSVLSLGVTLNTFPAKNWIDARIEFLQNKLLKIQYTLTEKNREKESLKDYQQKLKCTLCQKGLIKYCNYCNLKKDEDLNKINQTSKAYQNDTQCNNKEFSNLEKCSELVNLSKEFDSLKKVQIVLDKVIDSIEIEEFTHKKKMEFLLRNKIENVTYAKFTIFNVVFDVNELGIVTGVSFIIILILLRYTMEREYINLQIAFAGIENEFYTGKDGENFKDLEYYYHLLTMNVIFTWPHTKFSSIGINHGKLFFDIVRDKIYQVPFIVYIMLFISDIVAVFASSFGFSSQTTIELMEFIKENNVKP